jgi:hypothetical protein
MHPQKTKKAVHLCFPEEDSLRNFLYEPQRHGIPSRGTGSVPRRIVKFAKILYHNNTNLSSRASGMPQHDAVPHPASASPLTLTPNTAIIGHYPQLQECS